MAQILRPTGKHERGAPVSNLGYPIYNAPKRAIMPGELETVEHEGVFFSKIFNMEDEKDHAEYNEVMDRVINRTAGVRDRRPMDPTNANPVFRIYLEWYEVRAFFPEHRPNGKYTNSRR